MISCWDSSVWQALCNPTSLSADPCQEVQKRPSILIILKENTKLLMSFPSFLLHCLPDLWLFYELWGRGEKKRKYSCRYVTLQPFGIASLISLEGGFFSPMWGKVRKMCLCGHAYPFGWHLHCRYRNRDLDGGNENCEHGVSWWV